jgi:hypothetical protein
MYGLRVNLTVDTFTYLTIQRTAVYSFQFRFAH